MIPGCGGVIDKAVYRAQENPNELLVMHRFATLSQAQDFLASAELENAMREAGVEGVPQIDLYDEAE